MQHAAEQAEQTASDPWAFKGFDARAFHEAQRVAARQRKEEPQRQQSSLAAAEGKAVSRGEFDAMGAGSVAQPPDAKGASHQVEEDPWANKGFDALAHHRRVNSLARQPKSAQATSSSSPPPPPPPPPSSSPPAISSTQVARSRPSPPPPPPPSHLAKPSTAEPEVEEPGDPWRTHGFDATAAHANKRSEQERLVFVQGRNVAVRETRERRGRTKQVVTWVVPINGCDTVVELGHNQFWGKRTITVNGRVLVRERNFFDNGSRYDFELIGVRLSVRIVIAANDFEYELWVNDQLASHREADVREVNGAHMRL